MGSLSVTRSLSLSPALWLGICRVRPFDGGRIFVAGVFKCVNGDTLERGGIYAFFIKPCMRPLIYRTHAIRMVAVYVLSYIIVEQLIRFNIISTRIQTPTHKEESAG